MRATPPEIRKQIIEAKLRNENTKTIKKWTKVSKSTIDKIWSRYQKQVAVLPFLIQEENQKSLLI